MMHGRKNIKIVYTVVIHTHCHSPVLRLWLYWQQRPFTELFHKEEQTNILLQDTNKIKLSYLILQLGCKFIKCFEPFKMNYTTGVEPTTTTVSKKLNMKSSKS